jgi:ATP synthase protein I
MKPNEQYELDVDGEFPIHRVRLAKKKRNNTKDDVWFYFGIVGNIGYSIAIPIVGGALIGSYIDRRLFTYPIGTLLLLIIGCIISVSVFRHTMQKILQKKN